MAKRVSTPWVRQVTTAVTFGLLLCGLFYAGYANEQLKTTISDPHRAVLLIGFIVGVYAASSYLGVALAKIVLAEDHRRWGGANPSGGNDVRVERGFRFAATAAD